MYEFIVKYLLEIAAFHINKRYMFDANDTFQYLVIDVEEYKNIFVANVRFVENDRLFLTINTQHNTT